MLLYFLDRYKREKPAYGEDSNTNFGSQAGRYRYVLLFPNIIMDAIILYKPIEVC